MRRALVGASRCRCRRGPVGVFLMLRRMSLTGDAMAHAILPGAAVGLPRLRAVARADDARRAGRRPRRRACGRARCRGSRVQREDASARRLLPDLAGRSACRWSRSAARASTSAVLFGTVLALDDAALVLIGGDRRVDAGARSALIWRALVLECFDPGVPAQRQRRRAGRAFPLPGAGRAESRRRLPGARARFSPSG